MTRTVEKYAMGWRILRAGGGAGAGSRGRITGVRGNGASPLRDISPGGGEETRREGQLLEDLHYQGKERALCCHTH